MPDQRKPSTSFLKCGMRNVDDKMSKEDRSSFITILTILQRGLSGA